MSTPTLIGINYSPWSLRARWALDHHRVDYTWREYLPIFGALLTRLRARRWSGQLTVPVFIDSSGAYTDSFDIARRANTIGAGTPLFPAESAAEIARWNQLSERLLRAGRTRVTARTAEDPDARREAVPKGLRFIGPLVVKMGLRHLRRKYALNASPLMAAEAEIELVLKALEAGLRDRRTYLLDSFSYADITMAIALQMVSPVDDSHVPLGPATRRCWTEPELATRYPEVLAWRDTIFDAHA